jgi:hypothetical protein
MKRTFLIVAILLSGVSASLANIAQPDRPKKSLDTSLLIRLDSTAREAKLIIPRRQLQQLRAELDQLDNGPGDSAAAGSTVTRAQTIVSGGLLSLAFVFGGMWFVRSSSQNSKSVIAAALLLTFASVATLVYGNAGPPSEARSITGKMFTQGVHMYKQGSGAIKLEVSDTARNPELIVPDSPATADE